MRKLPVIPAFMLLFSCSGDQLRAAGPDPTTPGYLVPNNNDPGNNTTGWVQNSDPCTALAKTSVPISQTASALLITHATGKKNYICSIFVLGADAENVSLVEGTGSTCGTATVAVIGATTAANGPNLAANGGFTYGNGGATVVAGIGTAVDTCLFQSGSGRVAGHLTYVQTP